MESVSISGVISCHRCPVRFSLERELPATESSRYTIAKQLSYHIGELLDAGMIWSEVRAVAPDIDPAEETTLRTWIEACEGAEWLHAAEMDVRVSSEQFRIHGTVDRIFDEEPYFAIMRATEAPPAGVYATDRIRVACYVACMEELLGHRIEGGLVEYLPSGIARMCVPQPRDRRAAYRAIKIAHNIQNGAIPKRPKNPPCEHCHVREICDQGAQSLADILQEKIRR